MTQPPPRAPYKERRGGRNGSEWRLRTSAASRETPTAMKMLVLLLASWLVLAQSAAAAPHDEQPPPPPSDDLSQTEITDEIPLGLPEQEAFPEQIEIDLPLLIHGEPQFTPRGRKSLCSGGSPCTRRPPLFKLDEFPPARPSLNNLGRICAAGRRKVSYGPWNLPQSGFSHLVRQGDALNRMEAGLAQCCQLPLSEKLPCGTSVWEKSLTQFCKEDLSVKTRHHPCCKLDEDEDRFACFAIQAPDPDYNRVVRLVSLAEITPALLEQLCGRATLLLTKQRYIPALVKNITEPCCNLPGDERTLCATEAKSDFLATLCGPRRHSWKDPEDCCSRTEADALHDCFNLNYLASIPLAGEGQPPQPTRPAV